MEYVEENYIHSVRLANIQRTHIWSSSEHFCGFIENIVTAHFAPGKPVLFSFLSNAAKLLILKMFVLVEVYLLKCFGNCVVMLSNSNIAVVQFCFSLL